jgi:hypothetical protein
VFMKDSLKEQQSVERARAVEAVVEAVLLGG